MLYLSSFQLNSSGLGKNAHGSSRNTDDPSKMVNPVLVADNAVNASQDANRNPSKQRQPNLPVGRGKNTSVIPKSNSASLQTLRKAYAGMNLNNESLELVLKSWRKGTLNKYETTLKAWTKFCHDNDVSMLDPPLGKAVDFLAYLFSQGKTYGQICLARSALSAILLNFTDTFGKLPVVKRVMKGIFESKPQYPKYSIIWDVSSVFDTFKKLPHQRDLSIELLSKKLVLLIALLAGGQRMQTIQRIDLKDIKVYPEKIVIPIMDPLKQTKPNKHMKPLVFHSYPIDEKLCVTSNLREYLEKTLPFRAHSKLFLSYIKPHKPVTKDTIARWCKSMLQKSNIDINKYSSHSSTILVKINGIS